MARFGAERLVVGVTPTITVLLDASYALAVAGAAWIFPPLALVVAAVYLVGQAVIADRRTPPVQSP